VTRPLAAAALGLALAFAACGKYGPPMRASRLPPHATKAPAAAQPPAPAPAAQPPPDDRRDAAQP